MERGEDGVGGRTDDDGRGREPVHPGVVSDGVNGRTPEPRGSMADARGSTARRGTASWVNWQSALYVFVLGAASLVLAPLSGLWWIVPVLGALVPMALALLDRTAPKRRGADDKKSKEHELLNALNERGEITPATAAMHTSLTVDEASKMLNELVGKGHLTLQAEDGVMAYALNEWDRPPALDDVSASSDLASQDCAGPNSLEDPLSERELEVLTLLASGRTNSEIAKDLFVAVGTVKSHVNNIYRKLDARNRAEAVNQAREIKLLR